MVKFLKVVRDSNNKITEVTNMTKHIGSQIRDKIENTDYKIRSHKGNRVSLECGDHREVWTKNNHHSGYTLEINGIGYEFVSSHYENSDF